MTEIKLVPEVKAQWLAALRSGEYVQGMGVLTQVVTGSGQREYCCLGVLCDLAVRAGVPVVVTTSDVMTGNTVILYDWEEGLLPASVYSWATGVDFETHEMSKDFDVTVPNPDYIPDAVGDDEYSEYNCETTGSMLAEENDNGRDYEYIAALIEEQL